LWTGTNAGVHFAILPMRLYDPSKVREVLSLSPKDSLGLQVMDANLVAGYEHVLLAVGMAIKAWSEDKKIARSLAMEALLYASAKRQIKEAIETIGPSSSGECVILVLSDSKERLESILSTLKNYGTEDPSLIEITETKIPKIMKVFGINDQELSIARELHPSVVSAIQSLVLERISISDLSR